MIFSFLFIFIHTVCRILPAAKRKSPAAGKDSGGSKTKKGTNTTANPSYVLRKFFLFSSLIYSIPDFPAGANFLSDFFAAAGGRTSLVILLYGRNFCKKISRTKHAQPKDASWKRPLLSHIKYNIKPVKLQELNYIYSIPYFPQNTTAKPQHLPAVHTLIACGHFCLIQFCGRQMHRQPRCSSAGKKKRRECGASGFRAKISVYRNFFQAPAACTHSYRRHPSGIVFQNNLNIFHFMQVKLQVIHQFLYVSRFIERPDDILAVCF